MAGICLIYSLWEGFSDYLVPSSWSPVPLSCLLNQALVLAPPRTDGGKGIPLLPGSMYNVELKYIHLSCIINFFLNEDFTFPLTNKLSPL